MDLVVHVNETREKHWSEGRLDTCAGLTLHSK